MTAIDAGDTVKHGPTGETWVVAVVRDERLSACGWPESLADVSDCTLVRKATPEARLTMLTTWAAKNPGDIRTSYARDILAREGLGVDGKPYVPAPFVPSLLEACQATLLFYQNGDWSDEKRREWKRLTGQDEATTKSLCDAIRAAIAGMKGGV